MTNSGEDRTGCDPGEAVIEVASGNLFNVMGSLSDVCQQLSIRDIAASLSKLCRYNGHCNTFYSVAEHSIHCWEMACADGLGWLARRGVLLHDAHEAYVGDMSRPVKLLPDLAGFNRIAFDIQDAINYHWQCEATPEQIKRYDNRALKREAQFLMASKGQGWGLEHIEPADFVPNCWLPAIAEQMFLEACETEGIDVSC